MRNSSSIYSDRFFDKVDADSLASARAIVPLVRSLYSFESVVDVGCGHGAWLSAFSENGASMIRGYDGRYINRDRLLIPEHCFSAVDLSSPSDLRTDRQYDLAVCLEVAEHLPRKCALPLVRELCRLAKVVLFSAAIPGQGGTHHINEQWPEYWKKLFKSEGFVRLDPVRRHVVARSDVVLHFKQNTFLFVEEQLCNARPALLAEMSIAEAMDDVTIIASSRLVPLFSVTGKVGELLRGIIHSARNRLGC